MAKYQTLAESLTGKTIESVWRDSSFQTEYLMFVCADGSKVFWQADGGCCSHTWIENVDNLGFKGKFMKLTDDGASNESNDNHPEYDCLQCYGTTVFTEYGRLIIDYRNSSNGYYQGNLVVCDEAHIPTNIQWKEIEA